MAQWEKLSFAQKTCVTSAGKLMQQTGMLRPGARLGVAVSGGEDSFVLLKVLMLRQRIVPVKFELMVLHCNPGFDRDNHVPLTDWVARHGLPAHIEATDHGPRAHSPENRKNSPCFFCAWHRRKRLFDLCRSYRLTHLAFGHTSDDLASTFFLNLFQNGRVDGMSIREGFFGGELEVIRPLLWLSKETISRACRQWELPIWSNPCPSSGQTRRSDFSRWIDSGPAADKRIRRNLLNGLRRYALDRAMKKA